MLLNYVKYVVFTRMSVIFFSSLYTKLFLPGLSYKCMCYEFKLCGNYCVAASFSVAIIPLHVFLYDS